MRCLVCGGVLGVIASLFISCSAWAARPTEKRENAAFVVTGVVEAVYVQEAKNYRNYIVELRVEQVEKGTGVKKGDTFYAFCYRRKAGVDAFEADSSGHRDVPEERQRVKVFTKNNGGQHEGIYPDWFDALPAAKKK